MAAAADGAETAPELAIERDHALHRIRKAAKRLRYVAEDFTGDKAVGKQAKLIQTLLRDRRDSVVSREHLLEQADVRTGGRRGHLHLQGAPPAGGGPRGALRGAASRRPWKSLRRSVRAAR